MKKTLLLLALSVSLLVPCGGGAAARANEGSIDLDFGRGGKVIQPFGADKDFGAARLGDGHVFIAGAGKVEALTPGGRVDREFGDAGFISMARPQGAKDAGVSELLVDSRGRLLLLGNCTFPTEANRLGFYSLALVERFTADGRLDSSFGEDGAVMIDPALPREEPGAPPQVGITTAAFDSEGRIVFAGSNSGSRFETYVARLGAEGEIDRSFSGGALPVRATERIETLAPDATGGVYVSAIKGRRRVLFRIGNDGTIDRSFGEDGFRMQPEDALDGPVLQATTGRTLIYRYLSNWPAHHLAGGVQIKRLLPDGRLDRGFGRNGEARVRVPQMETSALRVDDEGRILVASELNEERGRAKAPGPPPALTLMRLHPDGGLDTSFGRRGILRVPYRKGWILRIHDLDVVGDEALISAFWYADEDRHAGRTLVRIHLGS